MITFHKIVVAGPTLFFIALKKCEEANAAQAKDLMAAAAEKAKVAQDASTEVAAAKAVDKTVSAGPKLRKLSDFEKIMIFFLIIIYYFRFMRINESKNC